MSKLIPLKPLGKSKVEISYTPINPINERKTSPLGPDLKNLKPSARPLNSSFQSSYNSLMNKLEVKSKPEHRPEILSEKFEEEEVKEVLEVKEVKTLTSSSIFSELSSLIEDPINEVKIQDLDEDKIETVSVSKRDCKILFEEKKIPYIEFRNNTDYIVFYLNGNFYGYSKTVIYNEYCKVHKQVYFELKLLDSNEDMKILWIPMSQIFHLLEYSHPVYEIEKLKFSANTYNIKPIKLKK